MSGRQIATERLLLGRSALRLRLPAERIGTALALAGKTLDVGGHLWP
jgi:hypothetical protein